MLFNSGRIKFERPAMKTSIKLRDNWIKII